MMAILPHIPTGRQEVINQLIWGATIEDAYSRWEDGRYFPWTAAIHAFQRRSALRVAGAIE